MEARVKLIWDFRGANAMPIAKHHAIHLTEYAEAQKLQNPLVGDEAVTPMHHIAYMIVEHAMMDKLREALKPHRGQLYED
ncbi:MAG TPA: hypothetical protein VKX40_10835 [Aequorivita sp.]|nr:hypothetical protein [Aequorivita sp.]